MDENVLLHKLIDLIQYKDAFQHQSSGIPPQDMYVLERVSSHGAIRISELSKSYSIPSSTLTGILDRLETKKYIQRIRKNDDRRAIELRVTDEGNALLQQHFKEDEIFTHNLFNTLSAHRKQALLELLKDLLGGVNKENLFHENEN